MEAKWNKWYMKALAIIGLWGFATIILSGIQSLVNDELNIYGILIGFAMYLPSVIVYQIIK